MIIDCISNFGQRILCLESDFDGKKKSHYGKVQSFKIQLAGNVDKVLLISEEQVSELSWVLKPATMLYCLGRIYAIMPFP